GSPSLVSRGSDGSQARRRAGRPDTEDDADHEAEEGCGGHGRRGEDEAPAGDTADAGRDDKADEDADEAAQQGQRQCFDEELAEDVPAPGAERLADAVLA